MHHAESLPAHSDGMHRTVPAVHTSCSARRSFASCSARIELIASTAEASREDLPNVGSGCSSARETSSAGCFGAAVGAGFAAAPLACACASLISRSRSSSSAFEIASACASSAWPERAQLIHVRQLTARARRRRIDRVHRWPSLLHFGADRSVKSNRSDRRLSGSNAK